MDIKTIVDRDIIRDSDGNLKPGCLEFYLWDFGYDLPTTHPNADLTKVIALHYNDLADYLAETELPRKPRPVSNIEVQEYPPSEEKLTSEDEKKCCALEKKPADHSEALDPDFSPDPEAALDIDSWSAMDLSS